ncbi:MAG: bis(5'-nucleosyl)-tetraphosphatase (symmetrical) YqeK [Clostridium sp.]|uniref:bis(5'-nucleosyl)-tetraphosphatase (symmetrical) YqeK n=1 Tax=Butyribacter sp. TaxID=2822465 RepID=UPI002A93C028|nr:bis(5'-nucleosyl)-tetraphosphatase (symmetrical) YqeK [Clostridium sp.]MDY5179982.1 bis(5'-nucleosyl)-tetraphosphatase (symmetrical) YqeK [Butyribacter sp.]
MKDEYNKIKEKLSKKLSVKRFDHTIGVSYTAAAMAMRYGLNVDRAAMAGLLHDCAKYMTDDELIEKCTKYGIECSETELRNGYLLHAKLGAYLSKEKYGIEDEEICSAVRYHTTGKPAMSVLEAIVFTADYIEPGRKVLSNFKLIRSMAFVDLDEAVYLILKNTLSYLNDEKQAEQSQKEIDKHSVEAYKYYKKIHDEKVGH